MKDLDQLTELTLQWTAPTLQHQLRVLPQQGTSPRRTDLQDSLVRVFSHWVIDHLPPQALAELVASLIEMFDFYGEPAARPQLAPSTKAFGRIVRSVRPDIVLPDEE